METRVLFALIPAMFALFALALASVAVLDCRLPAARWGAVAFGLASLGATLDAVRQPGHSWGLFYVHILVVAAFAQALAVRHRKTLPGIVIGPMVATAVVCGALSLAHAALQVRQTVFNLGLMLSLAIFARQCWRWENRRAIDRFVVVVVATLAASYAAKLIYLHVDPLSDSLSRRSDFFLIGPNLLFHFIMGVSGCLAGLLLLIVLGADVIRAQAYLLMMDPLTNTGNRHGLLKALAADKAGDWDCCGVIALDLDHFKSINDRFGHSGGDKLLALTGASLRRAVGPSGRLFRTGGEEFVLLVEGKHCDRIAELAELTREAVATARCGRPAQSIFTTASVGYHLRRRGESLDLVIELADRAMYAAKAAGRDRVARFDVGEAPLCEPLVALAS